MKSHPLPEITRWSTQSPIVLLNGGHAVPKQREKSSLELQSPNSDSGTELPPLTGSHWRWAGAPQHIQPHTSHVMVSSCIQAHTAAAYTEHSKICSEDQVTAPENTNAGKELLTLRKALKSSAKNPKLPSTAMPWGQLNQTKPPHWGQQFGLWKLSPC